MAFPKMVQPGKREAGWGGGLSADGRGTAWSPVSSCDEHSHQRPWRQPRSELMLTRLEWTELTFESDQMISVDYLGRKAKHFDISKHLGSNILEKLQRTD